MRSPGNKLSVARGKIVGARRRGSEEQGEPRVYVEPVESGIRGGKGRLAKGVARRASVNLWTYFSRRAVAINPAL